MLEEFLEKSIPLIKFFMFETETKVLVFIRFPNFFRALGIIDIIYNISIIVIERIS